MQKIMRDYFYSLVEILFAGTSYILLHELGHFMFAALYGLNPQVVFDGPTGLSLLSMGISYTAAPVFQESVLLIGSVILPFLAVLGFIIYGYQSKNKTLITIAEMYLIFIILNLLPIPGLEYLDANRIWSVLGV